MGRLQLNDYMSCPPKKRVKKEASSRSGFYLLVLGFVASVPLVEIKIFEFVRIYASWLRNSSKCTALTGDIHVVKILDLEVTYM